MSNLPTTLPEALDQIRELETLLTTSMNSATHWRDRYNREVEGLNNEGDPIGGPPACGLRHRVETLTKQLEEANKTIQAIRLLVKPKDNPQEIAVCARAT